MKKIIIAISIFICAFILTACGKKGMLSGTFYSANCDGICAYVFYEDGNLSIGDSDGTYQDYKYEADKKENYILHLDKDYIATYNSDDQTLIYKNAQNEDVILYYDRQKAEQAATELKSGLDETLNKLAGKYTAENGGVQYTFEIKEDGQVTISQNKDKKSITQNLTVNLITKDEFQLLDKNGKEIFTCTYSFEDSKLNIRMVEKLELNK